MVKVVVILFQGLGILAVGCANAADRRYAKANQVAVRLRAVALEIAMQATLALGHGQRVVWQCKVIHAHIHITRLHERRHGARQHRHFGRTTRQLHRGNAPLRLESLRQVGIGVQGDPVRAQFGNLRQRAVK